MVPETGQLIRPQGAVDLVEIVPLLPLNIVQIDRDEMVAVSTRMRMGKTENVADLVGD